MASRGLPCSVQQRQRQQSKHQQRGSYFRLSPHNFHYLFSSSKGWDVILKTRENVKRKQQLTINSQSYQSRVSAVVLKCPVAYTKAPGKGNKVKKKKKTGYETTGFCNPEERPWPNNAQNNKSMRASAIWTLASLKKIYGLQLNINIFFAIITEIYIGSKMGKQYKCSGVKLLLVTNSFALLL